MSQPSIKEIDADLMRRRILNAAEDHFRRIGYRKTTMSDIATSLGMSSANIYRYFPSRAEINAAICGRFFAQIVQSADAIARLPGEAPERLEWVLVALHRKRRATFIEERAVHDLIVVAMEENWEVTQVHTSEILGIIETIVQQGGEEGVFRVKDVTPSARSIMNAFLPFYHPTLVQQSVRSGQDTEAGLRNEIAFFLRALG